MSALRILVQAAQGGGQDEAAEAGDYVTDGDGSDGGGDDPMAIVLERIAALCKSHKLPLREVAETFAGFVEFVEADGDLPAEDRTQAALGGGQDGDTEPTPTPALAEPTRRVGLVIIQGGKS